VVTDFLLIFVQDLLLRRPDIRVILMSAKLQYKKSVLSSTAASNCEPFSVSDFLMFKTISIEISSSARRHLVLVASRTAYLAAPMTN